MYLGEDDRASLPRKHFGVLHLVDNEGGEGLHLPLRCGSIGGNKIKHTGIALQTPGLIMHPS